MLTYIIIYLLVKSKGEFPPSIKTLQAEKYLGPKLDEKEQEKNNNSSQVKHSEPAATKGSTASRWASEFADGDEEDEVADQDTGFGFHAGDCDIDSLP